MPTIRWSTWQRRTSSCQSGSLGLMQPKGTRNSGPCSRLAAARWALTPAISRCNRPSKLPAQACVTPLARSRATRSAGSSPASRRKGQRCRFTLVSIIAAGPSLSVWLSHAAEVSTHVEAARGVEYVGRPPWRPAPTAAPELAVSATIMMLCLANRRPRPTAHSFRYFAERHGSSRSRFADIPSLHESDDFQGLVLIHGRHPSSEEFGDFHEQRTIAFAL